MTSAKQKRLALIALIPLTVLLLVATVALILLAIWVGDPRFTDTAFLSFVLLIASGAITTGVVVA